MNKGFIKNNRKASILKLGFTLTELSVVIAIVAVISVISVFSFNEYTDKLWLKAVSQEVALMFRDAQTKAINVSSEYQYKGRFGVFMPKDKNLAILFVDHVNDQEGKYNGSQDECDGECIKRITFQRNVYVKDICTHMITVSLNECGKNSMSAVYVRPEPDAHMAFDGNSVNADIDSITVKLGLPDKSLVANINIGATGYVSISFIEDEM